MSFVFRELDGKVWIFFSTKFMGSFRTGQFCAWRTKGDYWIWFLEESEDFSKDGVLATRHSRKRGGKLFRGVIADDPEVGFQAPGIHSMLLNSPSLPWWRALNDDF